MTKLEELERHVSALPKAELDLFAAWFDELRAAQWDQQIVEGSGDTNLNALADEAISLHRTGQTIAL